MTPTVFWRHHCDVIIVTSLLPHCDVIILTSGDVIIILIGHHTYDSNMIQSLGFSSQQELMIHKIVIA